MSIEKRKSQEAKFHNNLREFRSEQVWSPTIDHEFDADPMWSNMKYYSVEKRNRNFVEDWKKKYCKSADVLDYCCGNGYDSINIALSMHPKSVTGIDISEVSIKNASYQAQRHGVSHLVNFKVMDAEQLEFPDNTFDTIIIYGVLHHLDLDRAYKELSRVLRPGGHIIATEALRHNPLIHAYRKRTPHLRTEWEVNHILGYSEIKWAGLYFEEVQKYFFNLATLAAVPLRKSKNFGKILRMLEAIDSIILSIPFIRWLAWMCVFIMSKPRKTNL